MSTSTAPEHPTSPRPGRKFLLWAIFAVVIIAIAIAGTLWRRANVLPGPGSPEYTKMVRAFYTGVIAMQVGDNKRALSELENAATIVPLEPAAHADLGVLALREGDFAGAKTHLDKAHELAPNNAKIEVLLGAWEKAQGNFDGAIAHLQHAIEIDANDLRARYELTKILAQVGAADADAKIKAQLDAILKAQPENLAALLEQARLAAKTNDASTLNEVLKKLAAQSADWPAEARQQLKELQAAPPNQATTPAIYLVNLLKGLPAYQSALQVLATSSDTNADPIENFLVLQIPSSQPAPPDTGISFAAQNAIEGATTKSKDARALMTDDKSGTLSLFNDGTTVQIIGGSASVKLPFRNGMATAIGDWDADFQNDLAFAGNSGVKFFHNNGGNFVDVTKQTQLSPQVLAGRYQGAWVADIEADGDLDIVLSRSNGAPLELRNNGDGSWQAQPIFASIAGMNAFVWSDFDSDNDNDAALLDGAGALHFFTNNRSGHFSERTDVPKIEAAALAVSDFDSDGIFDLLVWQRDGTIVRLWLKDSQWQQVSLGKMALPEKFAVARLLCADFDNNGAPDILASVDNQTQIWLGDIGATLSAPLKVSGSVYDVADLNGDGRIDLLGVLDGKATQWINAGTKNYHWQDLRARAQRLVGDGRINSFGIGGEMELRVGTIYQKQMIQAPIVHFGLGENEASDALRITWPNGDAQGEFDIKADQTFVAEQRLTGSCPYLFVWDGKQMRFVKDVNWRSPLGLKINSQDTAGIVQTQDWAHIRGDQMQAKNGKYDVRITADLWEADYFDTVQLLSVDHPKNTRVWVDERFSIPMPPLSVLTTTIDQPLARAIDINGHDVSATVRDLDANYLDCGRGQYQGVTRDHWLEGELPANAPRDKKLWLIAQGWLHPTDSSVNVALAQNGIVPQDLSLEVADGRGSWRVAQAHLGFPAGKNKAITIDLGRAFVNGAPRRFRLRTNLEIYWDKLSWAVGLDNTQTKIERLLPETAQLCYRGFSKIVAKNAASPELPTSYQPEAGTMARWHDLPGFYTRFGDVRPLLERIDDRTVIMNAGDEMRLQFNAPPAPTNGQMRDWVFISDGWTKDGNMNTTFSQTLLPLPAHNLAQTDVPPTTLQNDPVYKKHRDDWRDYHTRWVDSRKFQGALRAGLN